MCEVCKQSINYLFRRILIRQLILIIQKTVHIYDNLTYKLIPSYLHILNKK